MGDTGFQNTTYYLFQNYLNFLFKDAVFSDTTLIPEK